MNFITSIQICLTLILSLANGELTSWSCIEIQYTRSDPDLICNKLSKTRSAFLFSYPPRKLSNLEISFKNFTNLTDYAFVNFSTQNLDLSHNELETISDYSLVYLNISKSLILSRNKFKSIVSVIRGVSLAKISDIKKLWLDLNSIEKIDTDFTNYFRELRTLILNSNKIRFINKHAFRQTSNLGYLYLNNNEIMSLNSMDLSIFNSPIELFISYNNISDIFVSSPDKIINVRVVLIQSSNLASIEPFAFANYPILYRLDFSYSKISILRSNTFRGASNLTYIDFKYNRIETIEDLAFKDLFLLEDLDLGKNRIQIISRNIFSDCSSLCYLNLKLNIISSIEDYSFVNLSKLYSLDLSYNRLTTLTNRTFSGCFSLRWLDMTQNPIHSIDANTFVDSKSCCHSNVDDLIVFNLKQMQIQTVQAKTFNGLSSFLHCVDLSSNQIKSIRTNSFYGLTTVYELRLTDNLIYSIDSDSFSEMQKLEKLILSNNLIDSIEKSMFTNLKSLTTLFLAHNMIKFLPTDVFANMPNLLYLYLSQNEIRTIKEHTFSNLTLLTRLDMSFNKIEEVKSYYFVGLVSLTDLVLSHNRIILIDQKTFDSLRILEKLDLSYNSIENLRSDTFNRSSKLVWLDLTGNSIKTFTRFFDQKTFYVQMSRNFLTSLTDNSFLNMTNLDAIYLGENQISNISNKFYSFQTNSTKFRISLKSLYLNGNLLKNLNFLTNPFLISLTTLDLSFNQIQFITSNDFKLLTNLAYLYLSNNGLLSFGANAFINPKLAYLDLEANNFTKFTFDMKNINTNIKSILLSKNNFNSITFKKLPVLERFVFSNVSLDSITRIRFDMISTTHVLDLSCNTIEFNSNFTRLFSLFDRLYDLNLSRVGFKTFDSLNLIELEELNTLDLSFNSIESVYKNQTGFMKLMRHLYLNQNRISFIEKDSFVRMANLVKLNLENNLLIEFSFNELPSVYIDSSISKTILQKINYRFNKLRSIESLLNTKKTIFDDIKFMDFSFNSISSIEVGNFFSESNKVETFLLNNNDLSSIRNSAFAVFRSLMVLKLDLNRIESIEPYSFYLFNLRNLTLSGNQLTRLEPNAFDGLFQLRDLNLSSNRLEFIQSDLFKDLYHLVSLDLKRNFLRYIESMTFQNAAQLEYLSLQNELENNSMLIEFQNQTFRGLSSIRYIYLNYETLSEQNVRIIENSLRPTVYKRIFSGVYLNSINLIYFSSRINCSLTLGFIRINLHLNLSTDADVSRFIDFCYNYSFVFHF
jgi:Leucine-rich repeat (LRR) protein